MLRARAERAFLGEFEALFATLASAETVSDMLAARAPERFVTAASAGIDKISGLGAARDLPAAFTGAAPSVRSRKGAIIDEARSAAMPLERAAANVRELKLPEGTALQLAQGAVNAGDPRTTAGMGALGGAALGTLILPGVGTAIGGAIGAMLGQDQMSKANARVLAAHDEAFAAFLREMDAVFDRAWDFVVEEAAQRGLRLEPSNHFRTAENEWGKTRERAIDICGADAKASRELVTSFIEKWGPAADAIELLVRLSLPPHGAAADTRSARTWTRLALETYPADACAYENAADVALELSNKREALQMAQEGLRNMPEHVGLAASRLEASAMLGHTADATRYEEALRERGTPDATLYVARGFVRGADHQRGADGVRRWMEQSGKPNAIRLCAYRDPVLQVLFVSGSLATPSDTQIRAGIVETWLPADGEKTFFGMPGGDRGKNARAEFLKVLSREHVLFFLDWSVWGNGKTGLALTTERVLWKCLWVDAVAISFEDIAADSVAVDGATLRIGKVAVDVENQELAAGIAHVIREIASPP